jgi:hypothetical protein
MKMNNSVEIIKAGPDDLKEILELQKVSDMVRIVYLEKPNSGREQQIETG